MVKQAEMDEVRAVGLEAKARAKAEKDAERLRKRADKERWVLVWAEVQGSREGSSSMTSSAGRSCSHPITCSPCHAPALLSPLRSPGRSMHDAMQKLKEQQRLQAKAALMEAQRRQAELNATIGEGVQAAGGARSAAAWPGRRAARSCTRPR